MIRLQGEIQAAPQQWQRAQQGLLRQSGGQMLLWRGRAATALYDAYHVAAHLRADVEQPEIIMPAMMCTTAAHCARIAGMAARFADVDAQSGLLTLEHVQARTTANTIAVVVIHLFGHTVEIAPIAAWCSAHNILLIEDLAQALGARYPDGRYAGSVGDMAVYSFNRTKIIETGNGALVANTPQAAEALQAYLASDASRVSSTAADADRRAQLALSARNLHHGLVSLLRLHSLPVEAVSRAFMAVRASYDALYLKDANLDAPLAEAWPQLDSILERRLHLARIYQAELQGGPWTLLTDYERSGVCWRFSLLLHPPEKQVALSEAVRRDGFHVSNLYWPVEQFFDPADACPNADWFARRVLNLWVNQRVDADYVRRCCDSLRQHAATLLTADIMPNRAK